MKLLTIIITALNEGDEPLKTVQSIHETADSENFDIIVFNDGTIDWIDIPEELAQTVHYKLRKGAPHNFDLGVEMAKTKYIAIFNSRMRFKKGWFDKVMKYVQLEDNTIFCTTSNSLDEKGEFTKVKRYGADIVFGDFLEPEWRKAEKKDCYEIPCVLGANYFMRKRWYQYIRGFKGLEYYGGICVYLSLKSWAFGGKCKIIKDVEIGNIYRTTKPYEDIMDSLVWNKVFTAFVLLSQEDAEKILHGLDKLYYDIIRNRLIHEMEFIVREKAFILKHKTHDIIHLINK